MKDIPTVCIPQATKSQISDYVLGLNHTMQLVMTFSVLS